MSFKYNKILPDSEINKLFLDTNKSVFRPSFIEIGDDKFVIPEYYTEIANDVENFHVKDSDVFCVSYPKTGVIMSFKYNKILPDSEINKLFLNTNKSVFLSSYIEIGDDKLVMPEYYIEISNDIENFQVKDSDVFCVSYPKTGTTWTLEMLMQILNNVNEELSNKPATMKVPFLEVKSMFDYRKVMADHPEFVPPSVITDSIEIANKLDTNPRLLKTHLPWNLLPKQIRDGTKKPKIVYITRNPKDACVSFYHHSLFLHDYGGNLEQFCQLFLKDKVLYGSYWNHVSSFANEKFRDNILFITYEDMKADQAGVIKQVCKFLDKDLSDTQIERLVEILKFENMKKNHRTAINIHKQFFVHNHEGEFMRKGIVGSYKEEMSAEMMKTFDKWIQKNVQERNLHDFVKYNV